MNKLIFPILLLALLAACAPAPTSTAGLMEADASATQPARFSPTASHTPEPTPDRASTLTAAPTRTKVPTYTARPTKTTPASMTQYPTLSQNNTPAACPSDFVENPPKPVFIDFPEEFAGYADFEDEISYYLSTYGPEAIEFYLEIKEKSDAFSVGIDYVDITNDSTPEIFITSTNFFIFSCDEGEYNLIFNDNFGYKGFYFPPLILDISDINFNGIPELILESAEGRNGSVIEVIEWNGYGFSNYLFPDYGHGSQDVFLTWGGDAYFSTSTESISLVIYSDKNQNAPWNLNSEEFPFREEWREFELIERSFHLIDQRFGEPEYRYQAVQDGDRYLSQNDFEQALDYFQTAIFSNGLKWYSSAIKQYYADTHWKSPEIVKQFQIPTEDPTEYHYLASYARFRIMLLYVLQGWLSDAQVVYDTQQAMYPVDQPGHEFALMAEQFWLDYQQSGDIGLACAQAIAVAEQYPEILSYLGGPHHSARFDKLYDPVDVCPFGGADN